MNTDGQTSGPNATALLLAGFFAALQLEALVQLGSQLNQGPGWVAAVFLTVMTQSVLVTGIWLLLETKSRNVYFPLISRGFAALLALYMLVEHENLLLTGARFRGGAVLTASASLAPLVGSLYAELSGGSLVRVLMLLGLLALGWFRRPRWPRTWFLPLGLLAFGLLMTGTLMPPAAEQVSLHPLVSLIAGLLQGSPRPPPGIEPSDVFQPSPLLYGRPTPIPATVLAQLALLGRPRAGPPPHVVLVVLESVGAIQLLRKGVFDPALTPTLERLSRRGLIFPRLYGVEPGSLPSHVFLQSGGRQPTWEYVQRLQVHAYKGPTLPRSLRELGYSSAFFTSSFDFAGYRGHYERLFGAAATFQPATDGDDRCGGLPLFTWGCQEDFMIEKYRSWQAGLPDPSPRFMMFATTATHHPYATPANRAPRFPTDTRLGRWQNALNYTDEFLERLLERLRSDGVLENTILVVVGDHGQAFGLRHPGNLAHRNAIYEENIRNFCLYVDFARPVPGGIVERIVSLGDVAPTLAARTGGGSGSFVGQDLLDTRYTERIQFFRKEESPAERGLRDGRWKFITRAYQGEGKARLFDLATDPGETVDLAAEYPDRVSKYGRIHRQWSVDENADYVRWLEGYVPYLGLNFEAEDLGKPGPRALLVGCEDSRKSFWDHEVVPPGTRLLGWVFGFEYPMDTSVDYEWRSPSNIYYPGIFTAHAGASTASFEAPMGPLRETGRWSLEVRPPGLAPLTTEFRVTPGAPRPESCRR